VGSLQTFSLPVSVVGAQQAVVALTKTFKKEDVHRGDEVSEAHDEEISTDHLSKSFVQLFTFEVGHSKSHELANERTHRKKR